MNVRPLHDRIIVQRLEEGEQRIGGIIIPDSAKEKPQQGKVIAAGTGKVKDDGKKVPLDVKAGDLILFGKYSGQEIKLDGDEYLIMREDESEEKIGGIIIPDTAKEKPQRGKVVAAGNGKVTEEGKRVPLDVKSGDRILFGKYSGNEVKIDGDDYLILREEDVLAILE